AFVHPVVLLVVLLAMRRRDVAAAVVAAGAALLYPTAALLGCGVLAVAAVVRRDRRRGALALAALGGTAALVLLLGGGAPQVLTAAEAQAYPEFGAHGSLHFFVPSTVEYLRQNRSGFDLRAAGSVLLLAALALLLARRGNWRRLRVEVLALPAVALLGYAAAQAVLFKLYLPHRYTYPLVAFLAIAVGVVLRPAWERRSLALLAIPVAAFLAGVYLFPLGPTEAFGARPVVALTALAALAAGACVLRPAVGAAATGALLVAALLLVPGGWERGTPCPNGASVQYLATLPKDAVIAGDPRDLMCLPATARRPVVTSTQLAPSYEADYFLHGRDRMFDMLRAYYGPSPAPIAELADRYGATHLWVRRAAVERETTERGARWRQGQLPYGRFVRDVVRGGTPAVLDLPAECRRWSHGTDEVYDIACLAAR
ncbi:MAG TPA: DUF2079 domain-containing protein, partial [Solirubrobacteraceae bacterium]|nr:DUF2079 domain-containing protein [Solirubrobacteraceae bacterium]